MLRETFRKFSSQVTAIRKSHLTLQHDAADGHPDPSLLTNQTMSQQPAPTGCKNDAASVTILAVTEFLFSSSVHLVSDDSLHGVCSRVFGAAICLKADGLWRALELSS
jgi:hypothetical protein